MVPVLQFSCFWSLKMYVWGVGTRCLFTFFNMFLHEQAEAKDCQVSSSHWTWSSPIQLGHLASQWAPEICLPLPPQHWYYRCVLQCLAFSEDVGDPNSGPESCLANMLSTEPSPQPPKNSLSKNCSLVCEQTENNSQKHHCGPTTNFPKLFYQLFSCWNFVLNSVCLPKQI